MNREIKKIRLCIITITFIICFVCTACGKTYEEAIGQDIVEDSLYGNYFIIVTEWNDSAGKYMVVYAKDTKVKYFIASNGYKFGITPLYNADGTLQVYKK